MQPNAITLSVDEANDATIVATTFNRYEEYLNRSVYAGETHVPESRDTITMYRSFPTKSGNFKGVKKSSVKLTRDFDVAGVDGVATLTSPAIVELSFSLPVGLSAADITKLRQTIVALADDDAIMDALNQQLMV